MTAAETKNRRCVRTSRICCGSSSNTRLAERGEALASQALHLPEVADADRLGEAVARAAAGRNPFGFFGGFGRSPVKDAVQGALIAGDPPRDAAGWTQLAELHAWRADARRFSLRWNAFAVQYGLPSLPDDHAAARAAIDRLARPASEMLSLSVEARARLERLRILFPYGLEADAVVLRIDVAVAIEALRANMGDVHLIEAEQLCKALRIAGERVGGDLGEALCQVAEGLGSPEVSDAEAAARWRQIQTEVDRLTVLTDDLRRLSEIASLVRQSGAGEWATQIERQPPAKDDPLLPCGWRDAWDFARASGYLTRVINRQRVQQLTNARSGLVAERERRFLEAIELLTYLVDRI
jgi:hypothetical protein